MQQFHRYLILTIIFFTLSICSSTVSATPDFGPVDMGEFYASLPDLNPNAKLGTIVKLKKIKSDMKNVNAWLIAYVSSDVNNHKTLVTGLLVAPSGVAPARGRPIVAWAHGTTGTAQSCGPSQALNPAQPLNEYFLLTGNSYTDFGLPAMAPFDIAVTMPANVTNDADARKYLQSLGEQFSENIFNFTHYAQNIWGTAAAFPNLKVEDIFTDQAAGVINTVMERKCMHVATGTFSYLYGENYKSMLRSDIKDPLAWVEADRKGSVPPVKPMAPVIIYYGSKDVTVPPIMGKLYQEQMCKLGGNVTRVQLPGEQTHFSTPASAEPLYVKWVADRFAGIPAQNGC